MAASGDVDSTFAPTLDNYPFGVAVQPDGKILLCGQMVNVNGVGRPNATRLNADGTLDAAFNTRLNTTAADVAVQSDGKIVFGGVFNRSGATVRNEMARFNADGTLDAGYNPNVAGLNSAVESMAVQPDGKIIISSYFLSVGGVARNSCARVNTDGSVDTGFNPNVTGDALAAPYSSAVQADGKIVIGGRFRTVGTTSRLYLARLNADGTVDASFNPSPNDDVDSVAVQPDGKILIAGNFTKVGTASHVRVARLNADGSLDGTFTAGASGIVNSMVLQADGKIILGGIFTSINSTTRNRLARLNADGTLDATFNPNVNNQVYGVALQEDGKLIVIGTFTAIGGVTRNYVARLNNDAPTQSLATTGTSGLQWMRGGAAPESQEATFELSSNGGTTWTSLGGGTRVAGGWQLNGLSLPSGGQVRARGRTISGQYNGSTGVVDQVISFAFAPDMAVEQPVGTGITDGGSTDFGSVAIGASTSLTLSVTNTGNGTFTDLAINTDGANPGEFIAGSPGTTTLSAGASTTFGIQFSPTGTGLRTAAIHIASNVTGAKNPFDINLTGTGTGLTALQNWRLTYYNTTTNSGNAGDTAAPYGNAITNLQIFAFLGPTQNPATAQLSQMPLPQLSNGTIVYNFPQPLGVSDILYGAQYATSLNPTNWQPITDSGIGTQHIFSVPIDSNQQVFVRLTTTEQ